MSSVVGLISHDLGNSRYKCSFAVTRWPDTDRDCSSSTPAWKTRPFLSNLCSPRDLVITWMCYGYVIRLLKVGDKSSH